MNRRLALLVLPLLLTVAGCTSGTVDDPAPRPAAAERPSPFRDCAGLSTAPTAASPGAGTAASPGSATATPKAGELLPELTLACFTGGTPVALRDVAGPAVINVWASWCPPCRKELPAFQRLSARSAGQLQVIGVNSRDSRGGAQSIGEDFGVRFPILVDQGEALQRELKRNAIPLTLFVDAQGRIRHIDATGALDDAQLAKLVRQHLGLVVSA
ncbi:TlpA family protein disulfide reductase [Micromonospora parathelypteridis]|uniref:Thiol-disulfide isomerase/thioredoxin n=1 Tax=Micromonospora parathelypteridis TaxID=1839617 RepID=A0A840W4F4_9ACTN|nr:TlpA disulfide reductase family protein [Micromonospora parathelypteridis]MBB5478021.1 thiol-disulfide isomerase/thioredoxin [Micromonospora parathelypteridis]GGO12973.1 thiol:disulfide interchange protein [Micromonospora parathelypteridis]